MWEQSIQEFLAHCSQPTRQDQLIDLLEMLIETELSEEEREIIRVRYWLGAMGDHKPISIKVLAERQGVTRYQMQRTLSHAEQKLLYAWVWHRIRGLGYTLEEYLALGDEVFDAIAPRPGYPDMTRLEWLDRKEQSIHWLRASNSLSLHQLSEWEVRERNTWTEERFYAERSRYTSARSLERTLPFFWNWRTFRSVIRDAIQCGYEPHWKG